MANQSIDDDYNGCSEDMRKLVDLKYLPWERCLYRDFGLAWRYATKAMQGKKPREDNLTMDHAIAIHVYTSEEPFNIYTSFNDDVREGRNKYKQDDDFRFHALHFLLTDAIQRLRKNCVVTYRGTDKIFKYNKGEVRFGAFTSTSEDENVALTFGDKSCFKVKTCLGASVSKYSAFGYEREVIIPPYEVFKVVKVHSDPKVQPMSLKKFNCGVVYQLESAHAKSNLECALFKKREWERG